ncbi:MAG: clostripain-related cysteine peptidase [Candidatus Bathyarchaeia archaeon]
MKIKQACVLVLVSVVILAVSQHAPLVFASKNSRASWTFMVYLDADNNLDEYGQINLEQMQEGLASNAAVNVIVLMDRLNLPAYVYEVTHENIKTVQSLGEVDMGNQQTLSYFVTFAMKKYPANYFFLDLWDHGGGYRGICWDESSGNHLSPHDIEMAVALAESQTKKFVNVIGFDACLMGMIEICYELKDVTNIVIGSEVLIPGLGWPYTQLMAYLSSNPQTDPPALSTYLVNEYVAYYPKYTVQLSAINEELIPEVTISLNNFTDALMTNISEYKGVVSGARSDAQQKFILGTMGSYFYVDLYKFTMLVSERTCDGKITELASNLMSKLDLVVFAEAHTAQIGNLDAKQFGLTVNFPPNIQTYNSNYEKYVPCFVQETLWQSFLMSYYAAI